MDSSWQVIIGTGIGGLLLALYGFYKDYVNTSKEDNESQTIAKWSIVFGLSGLFLVGLGGIIGLILGFRSKKGKKHKALSYIGIFLSILTALPWIAVFVWGP
ncbi:MAG: hypothetical protein PF638_04680 [Candidatus Delongbacteria bacterium]|jgi:uncharacterized membrane protein|nr:hypothetical protein [Candidatus Delongbacteria bacterium]